MNQNYFHAQLSKYLDKKIPISFEKFSKEELIGFISARSQLAEKEYEYQRKKGLEIIPAQELAVQVLFENLIPDDEAFIRDFIEKNFSDTFEYMIANKNLNLLIIQILPYYHELLTDTKIPTELKKYELITKIDNLILSNGF
jgi:hypothetical protein